MTAPPPAYCVDRCTLWQMPPYGDRPECSLERWRRAIGTSAQCHGTPENVAKWRKNK